MGVDVGKFKKTPKKRTEPKSRNAYLSVLFKIYSVLAKKTDSEFNKTVQSYLKMTRLNKSSVSIRKLQDTYEPIEDDYREKGIINIEEIMVVVGSVLDDERVVNVRPMRVVALKFSKSARMRITKAGGECLTFDQLALLRPTGTKCVILRGDISRRKTAKCFGIPGEKDGSIQKCSSKSFKKTERGSSKDKKRIVLFKGSK